MSPEKIDKEHTFKKKLIEPIYFKEIKWNYDRTRKKAIVGRKYMKKKFQNQERQNYSGIVIIPNWCGITKKITTKRYTQSCRNQNKKDTRSWRTKHKRDTQSWRKLNLMYSIIQPFRNRCLDAYLYAPNQIKYENLISFNSIRKLKS